MAKKSQDRQERFAPVPSRALSDTRLSALELRTLAVIAAHDQFKRNGQGCYASHSRLAGIVRAHITNLTKAISRLIEFGYVGSMKRASDRRFRVYWILYTPEDESTFLGSKHRKEECSKKRSMVDAAAIDGPDTPVTHGNHSQTQDPIYSPKGTKYKKEIDPPKGDPTEWETQAEPNDSIDKASLIANEVRNGKVKPRSGIDAIVNSITKKASVLKQIRPTSEADQIIDATLDRVAGGRNDHIGRMESNARPSPGLLNSVASRTARDL